MKSALLARIESARAEGYMDRREHVRLVQLIRQWHTAFWAGVVLLALAVAVLAAAVALAVTGPWVNSTGDQFVVWAVVVSAALICFALAAVLYQLRLFRRSSMSVAERLGLW